MHKRVTGDRLISDLRAVVDDAEALLKATSVQTGEEVQSARTRVEQSLHQSRKRLAHAEADAVERAHKAAKTAPPYEPACFSLRLLNWRTMPPPRFLRAYSDPPVPVGRLALT